MPDTVKTTISLGRFHSSHATLLKDMERAHFSRRLWGRDPTLWKKSPGHKKIIRNSLGWLTVPALMKGRLKGLDVFSRSIKDSGFSCVLLLGMGGSSIAPLVFSKTFGPRRGRPRLLVLDSTSPDSIKRVEGLIDPAKTLFIVASKSGATIEVSSLFDYFYDMVEKRKGKDAGRNFIAITDPDTPLAGLSAERGFISTFLNPPDIGGRYSALSYFGLVPASLTGMDVGRLLSSAIGMSHACSPKVRESQNPAVMLGCALGLMAREGKNKVTFFLDPEVSSFGLWIEQLISESVGKEGKGLIPVVGEPIGAPSDYGPDRVFISIGLKGGNRISRTFDGLRAAGYPALTFELQDRYALGGEFFRWEAATAALGAILKVNPFDQPDVEGAKKRARGYIESIGQRRGYGAGGFSAGEGKLGLSFGKSRMKVRGKQLNAKGLLKKFAGLLKKDAYIAVLSYLDPEDGFFSGALTSMRVFLRDRTKAATQFGYGPRYLHSTGQLHKGGPRNGLFIIIAHGMGEGEEDVRIPARRYSFGELLFSQALGDMEALDGKGRPVVLFNLGNASRRCLKEVFKLIKDAFKG
ncbi:MAG: glucose-6-phosphate isomerase [Deltaproteobacteria bacterium]|nr:glucose-6-phosphate isomerase [Deltaproteobacteria bacterium]